MSDDFDFGSLDLSEYDADSGEMRLKPGRYVCRITEASLEKVTSEGNKGGRRLQVVFADRDGHGTIRESINVHLPKSSEATEIGKKQLKTLLTHAGHPTPNNPGDISSIKGLVVGVNVDKDTFKNDRGDIIPTSKVHGWHPYFNPEGAVNLGPSLVEVARSNSVHPNQTGGQITETDFDDIPF